MLLATGDRSPESVLPRDLSKPTPAFMVFRVRILAVQLASDMCMRKVQLIAICFACIYATQRLFSTSSPLHQKVTRFEQIVTRNY
jgi:hypothetical protein